MKTAKHFVYAHYYIMKILSLFIFITWILRLQDVIAISTILNLSSYVSCCLVTIYGMGGGWRENGGAKKYEMC